MSTSTEPIVNKIGWVGLFTPFVGFIVVILTSFFYLNNLGGGDQLGVYMRFVLTELGGFPSDQLRITGFVLDYKFIYIRLSLSLGVILGMLAGVYCYLPLIEPYAEKLSQPFSKLKRLQISISTAILYCIGVSYGYVLIKGGWIVLRSDPNGEYALVWRVRELADLLVFIPLSFGMALVLPIAWLWLWKIGAVSEQTLRDRWYGVIGTFVLFSIIAVPQGFTWKAIWVVHPIIVFYGLLYLTKTYRLNVG